MKVPRKCPKSLGWVGWWYKPNLVKCSGLVLCFVPGPTGQPAKPFNVIIQDFLLARLQLQNWDSELKIRFRDQNSLDVTLSCDDHKIKSSQLVMYVDRESIDFKCYRSTSFSCQIPLGFL